MANALLDPAARDRARGCLLGLAAGDALGAAVEFSDPGSFPPVTGYRGGGPFALAPGEWTDDTSLALALADSIGAGWDLADQCRRYVDWWQTGRYSVNGRCFDIGITTRNALHRFTLNPDPRASGAAGESSSGNGSIMRLAPVPVWAAGQGADLTTLARWADESSLTTHASAQCRSACRYFAAVLAALIRGEERDAALAPDWPTLQELGPLEPKVAAVAAGSFRTKQPPAIRGSGWVVESLEAALWAFYDAPDFATAVLKAVNLGDDADTTGAVCGQLAGAYWGEAGIPEHLRDGLARRDMLEQALASLGVGPGHAVKEE